MAKNGDNTNKSSSSYEGEHSYNDDHVIDLQVWYGEEKPPNKKERAHPSIPKVPATLRDSPKQKLPNWYRPTVVSIGPYYYNSKESRFEEAQKRKSWHAEKFIEESGQDKDDLYRKIRERTAELRNCYDKRGIKDIDDNKLATIFLLDGCFVLHFINHSGGNEHMSINALNFTNHEMNHIKQDLFLLENQLPYKVLKLLFKHARNYSNDRLTMEQKIKDFVGSHAPFPRGVQVEEVNHKPSHLLHYLQDVILHKVPRQTQDEAQCCRRPKSKWHSYCKNVQELRKVGIHFNPSPTSYLTDISFNPHFGVTGCLKLPPISMNTSTMIIFLNLIAFESSNTTTNNLGVISYLCFLNSLIDRWDDVRELQAAGILRNFVGDRSDVAQFFNNVCNKLVPDPSAYRDVILQIENHMERHQKSRLRGWYIQCMQKYFSSPWSCIALVAAIIGLSLTAIQAYTSVFSH